MDDDLNLLKKALRMFKSDEYGVHLAGGFFDLPINVFGNHNTVQEQDKNKIAVAYNLRMIQQDIWNIATLIERLEWMQKEGNTIEHIDQAWMRYASVDIEHFHTEIRSIMDYAAKAIGYALGLSGKLPDSFRKLRDNVKKYKMIPKEIVSLILNAYWFSELRGIRDALIHSGADTLVFGNRNEGILFQIFKRDINKIIDREIFLFNPNIVYFDRYASYYFCHLIIFLESIFIELSKNWQFNISFGPVRSYSPGFAILLTWSTSLVQQMEIKRP